MAVNPLVSLIIPVYNGSNYMREAIDSALAQTYPNLEIIVVNDGSSDGGETERIALSYGDRIRYIHKPNGGVSSALNMGIQAMNGEYLSWLSHDDVYTPNKVERQVQLLQEFHDPRMVAMCATQQIDRNSAPMGSPSRFDLPIRQRISRERALSHIIDHSCNGCALLIPRGAFEECGGFHEGLRYSQDFLMWMQIFLAGYSLVYDREVSVLSRVHPQQVTQTRKDLFAHDSRVVAEILAPELEKVSSKEQNFLYAFAATNAIHSCEGAVGICMEYGRTDRLMSAGRRLRLKLLCAYGRIRPFIRKVYYRLFK